MCVCFKPYHQVVTFLYCVTISQNSCSQLDWMITLCDGEEREVVTRETNNLRSSVMECSETIVKPYFTFNSHSDKILPKIKSWRKLLPHRDTVPCWGRRKLVTCRISCNTAPITTVFTPAGIMSDFSSRGNRHREGALHFYDIF